MKLLRLSVLVCVLISGAVQAQVGYVDDDQGSFAAGLGTGMLTMGILGALDHHHHHHHYDDYYHHHDYHHHHDHYHDDHHDHGGHHHHHHH